MNKDVLYSIDTNSENVCLKVKGSSHLYLIKRISTPYSSFSKARWLKSNSPIMKDFNPTIVVDDKMYGNVLYYVFNNTLVIPKDLSYSTRIK